MSKISFVYFDVGGVAIKDFSDTNKWDAMLDEALGIPTSLRPAFDQLYDQFENDICLGRIAVDDLKPYIKANLNPNLDLSFSMIEYFLDHFEKNVDLWPLVNLIQKNAKIGLLTDQYPGMLAGIMKHDLMPSNIWDVIVDSSVEKVRKPMPEIYDLAQKKAGVPAGEILFIDNRQKNLDGAKNAGWQTYLYDSSDYNKSNQELADFISQNL